MPTHLRRVDQLSCTFIVLRGNLPRRQRFLPREKFRVRDLALFDLTGIAVVVYCSCDLADVQFSSYFHSRVTPEAPSCNTMTAYRIRRALFPGAHAVMKQPKWSACTPITHQLLNGFRRRSPEFASHKNQRSAASRIKSQFHEHVSS